MPEQLGKIERLEAEHFKRGKKLYLVPLVYFGEEAPDEFIDVGIKDIEVNPLSPLLGEPFEITVTLVNKGKTTISTPFYLQVEMMPNDENAKPTVVQTAISKILEPGDEATASFKIALVTNEGPLRIIASADFTYKLGDDNPSNNMRGKTVIISSQ